ncbi:XRE family transcriptional regulator [Cohnella endophytica]|uniref:XRE family transcriptional regulator n=1 Tax=Cohnella endophytica TaxID=2419778 RepID=A0A494XGZ6_9BACL|nr:helix-turn-helix transcriptional regulator [Cohnella endophytica]RKP50015.1 XRE family transcriptional regulator [Cohnella endophytica]
MSDFLRLVGEQLRLIMKAKGLTQEKVAERSGIKVTRISDIERGQTNASLKTLEKIINALEIAPNELFNFQKLNMAEGIEDKRLMVEIHKSLLLERGIDDVKYVIGSANSYLNAVDAKNPTKNRRKD